MSGKANQWYVCRSKDSPKNSFEVYYYKEHVWGDRSSYYDGYRSEFFRDHREIDEETASKCIIAGPEFCLEKQKELKGY